MGLLDGLLGGLVGGAMATVASRLIEQHGAVQGIEKLAQTLPRVVDKLTPNGVVPHALGRSTGMNRNSNFNSRETP